MTGFRRLREIIDQTTVLRFPRHRLATFGDSEIQYHLVTPHPDDPGRALLRSGRVRALRPKIITLDAVQRRFEGFGEDAAGYERLLRDVLDDDFRGLEYVFHNHMDSQIEHHRDARELAAGIRRDLDERDAPRAAVIQGPARGWELSLMKFTLEETGRSFPVNWRELDEHGLIDPARAAADARLREIETLFRAAAQSSEALKPLAAKLKEYGLFNEYQDRFFALARP
jgi:hypothetical protein